VFNNAYKKPYVPIWERNFSERLFSWLAHFLSGAGPSGDWRTIQHLGSLKHLLTALRDADTTADTSPFRKAALARTNPLTRRLRSLSKVATKSAA
jgi:hypothetical protein